MKYFIIAGEASGDMHGAGLIRELKLLDPEADFRFLGGDAMAAEGGVMIRHYREMAFMGFVQVLRNTFKILKNFRLARTSLLDYRPDVVVLIDYPGFNMKISTFVVKQLQVPVYYYIVPKVWAWKTYRVKQLKRELRALLTIFPFETEFFARYGAKVQYVGNPSVDAIHRFLQSDRITETDFREEFRVADSPYIALLPGSRRQEIRSCLPDMVRAVESMPGYKVLIAGAPGIEPGYYEAFTEGAKIPVVMGQTHRLVRYAAAAVVNSGTATLETALLNTPQVVVYHVKGGKFTYWMKNTFLKTPYISLVNILMQREVVRELVAHLMTADNIKQELLKIVSDGREKAAMLKAYGELQKQLGSPGTAGRAAAFIVKDMESIQPATQLQL